MAEKLRIATYNVEWFNALFDNAGHLRLDRELSARHQVSRADQLDSLGIVFTALDADAIMVIEAPDTNVKRKTVTALERFARHYELRTHRALIGFPSDSEQEIAFLYDPDRLSARHSPRGAQMPKVGTKGTGTDEPRATPRFDGVFRYDLDADGVVEQITWSKPPLELAVTTQRGRALRLIGVHAKSKAPHGARDPAEVTRLAIENRRKQLAQCIWLRKRVEAHLSRGDDLIVMGDFNDGPGIDEFEKLFGHSGVEIVLGHDAAPAARLHDPHASMVLTRRLGLSPTTARFYSASERQFFEALLDFIMVSPGLCASEPHWRIWHPFNDPAIARVPELRDALLTASDHFPVTLDLSL